MVFKTTGQVPYSPFKERVFPSRPGGFSFPWQLFKRAFHAARSLTALIRLASQKRKRRVGPRKSRALPFHMNTEAGFGINRRAGIDLSSPAGKHINPPCSFIRLFAHNFFSPQGEYFITRLHGDRFNALIHAFGIEKHWLEPAAREAKLRLVWAASSLETLSLGYACLPSLAGCAVLFLVSPSLAALRNRDTVYPVNPFGA